MFLPLIGPKDESLEDLGKEFSISSSPNTMNQVLLPMLNALLLLPELWANQKIVHVWDHLTIDLSLCLFLVASANHTRSTHSYRVIASKDRRSHRSSHLLTRTVLMSVLTASIKRLTSRQELSTMNLV
jgi:hypothetical protein